MSHFSNGNFYPGGFTQVNNEIESVKCTKCEEEYTTDPQEITECEECGSTELTTETMFESVSCAHCKQDLPIEEEAVAYEHDDSAHFLCTDCFEELKREYEEEEEAEEEYERMQQEED